MALVRIGCPQPHLVHQIDVVVLERRNLSVRRLMIVVVEQLPAATAHRVGQIDAEPPSRNVNLMNAVVSRISRPVIPPPMPFVVVAIAIERALWRRSEPHIVVQARRCLAVCRTTDRAAELAVDRLGHPNLTQLA